MGNEREEKLEHKFYAAFGTIFKKNFSKKQAETL
jgi:hypothetical protein